MRWQLRVEMLGPAAVGGLAFVVNSLWFRFAVESDWGNRLLDRVIQASGLGAAFWGVAITLMIGMENRRVIEQLKRLRYYRNVIQYFGESLFACFTLVVLSVLFELLSARLPVGILSSAWVGVGIWALLTTARTYAVLASILIRYSEE